jgi:hypothetical protein
VTLPATHPAGLETVQPLFIVLGTCAVPNPRARGCGLWTLRLHHCAGSYAVAPFPVSGKEIVFVRAVKHHGSMSDSSQIVPLLVGGALGIAGTVISQFFGLFSGSVERRHQTALRRKKTLEKMVDLITECQPWFQRIKLCREIRELQETYPPLQARQVVMLARISFPSIERIAVNWSNAHVRYYSFAAECFSEDVKLTLGTQMAAAISRNLQFQAREDEPMIWRNQLDDAIAEEAKKYLEL